jgi:hypothetical protein
MRSLTDDRAAERRARALLDGGRARVVRCEASEVAVIGDDEPLYVFQVEPDRLFLVDGDELDDVDERFPCDDFEIATLVDATGAHDGTVVTSRGRRLRPTRKYSDAVREHFAERDDRSVVPGRVDQIELLPSRAD